MPTFKDQIDALAKDVDQLWGRIHALKKELEPLADTCAEHTEDCHTAVKDAEDLLGHAYDKLDEAYCEAEEGGF
jgi:predicted  nucleic acid-binding Zn-ribbon protein